MYMLFDQNLATSSALALIGSPMVHVAGHERHTIRWRVCSFPDPHRADLQGNCRFILLVLHRATPVRSLPKDFQFFHLHFVLWWKVFGLFYRASLMVTAYSPQGFLGLLGYFSQILCSMQTFFCGFKLSAMLRM